MSLPILLIGGCQKYRPYLNAAIRRIKSDKWETIAFVGGEKTNSFDPESRILFLTAEDTYEALPAKLHAAFSWIFEHYPNSPGIFKTDDDLLYPVPMLEKAVQENQQIPYWGVVVTRCVENKINLGRINARFNDKSLRPSHQAATYCFGWGYWVNRTALSKIAESGDDYRNSYLEDVCTGYVLNRAGMIPHHIDVPYREVPRDQTLLNL